MTPRRAMAAAVAIYLMVLVATIWLFSLDTIDQQLARYTMPFVLLGPAAVVVGLGARVYQRLDELARRIHLMALSVAYLGTVVLVFTVTLVVASGKVDPVSWVVFGGAHVGWKLLGTMGGLYLVGWLLARRRYS